MLGLPMLKKIRIGFWLLLLTTVLMQMWAEYRALQWQKPLYVAVYPINADGAESVSRYIRSLRASDFQQVEDFFSQQALQYQLPIRRPISIRLGDEITALPPAPPAPGSALWQIIRWSLLFRWYAFMHQPSLGHAVDIKLYLLYYDVQKHQRLLHSTALNKGRIGRVNLFAHASQHSVNMVVMAHELLHTINATDKYNLIDNAPLFPMGFAEPYAQPLYPQSMAEIMAGKVPVSETESRMARDLTEVVIGRQTAREIGWLR